MNVDLQVSPVDQGDAPVLRRLVDLYAYDFSVMAGLDVDDEGRFAFPQLDAYWTDAWRHPFFLRADGKLAGFALVHGRSRLSGSDGVHDMAEFFVLRRHRRRGIGEHAARFLFDRFRGPWEVRERADNVEAQAFWRLVIDRHTQGRYHEVVWNDDTWRGPVQSFTA